MPYQVFIESQARKQLEKINDPAYSVLKKAIMDLANNPRPNGCKKLKGRPGFRIRKGDFRIIYTISDKELYVLIIDLGNRKDIYD